MKNIIYGKNSVLDAISSGVPIKKVYATKNTIRLIDRSLNAEVVSQFDLDKMAQGNNQGLVAELKEFNYFNIQEIYKDKPEKVLILDHIQDPHNFGAIIRTANARGIKHIIIPKDRAVQVTPTVLKVASGGYVDMKIIRVDSLQPTIKDMKDKGFWIYATALNDKAVTHKQATYNDPMAIIVGNEQKGVNNTLLKMADQVIYIPMEGTVQSLNVSVATGIVLFSI